MARVLDGLTPAVQRKTRPVVPAGLAERMAHFRVPGVSVAVVDGGRFWARGFGAKEAGHPGAVAPTTLFQAASISKPITATATLQLVARKRLSLDEDVNGHLRSWRLPDNRFTAKEKVTLRRILSHSAGLTVPSYPGYGVGDAVPTLLEVLDGRRPAKNDAVRVTMTPGTVCRYSGGGIAIEQLVLMDVTGRPFPQLIDELVFQPLGMADSTFEQQLTNERAARAASAHDARGRVLPGRHRLFPEMAAAGLWTTPTDLLRWAMTVAGDRAGASKLLSQAMATEMLTVQKGPLGLGPFLAGVGRDFNFSHRGWNPGFHSKFIFYPERGQGAAVMTNGDGGGRPIVDEVLLAIGREFGWPVEPRVIEALSVEAEANQRVTGIYRGMKPHTIEVTATLRHHDDRVLLDAPVLGIESEVVFTGRDELTATETGDRFHLVKGADGSVTALVFGDVRMRRQDGRIRRRGPKP